MTYFKYSRSQRSMAITLLLNAVVAYAMYLAAAHYLPKYDQAAATEIMAVADIAIWIIEAILVGIALYFWFKNKSIELSVTAKELHYFAPTFADHGWTVPIAEVVALEQFTDVQRNYSTTLIALSSGERKQLMYNNFSIDRKVFFAALKQANPKITLPKNPYYYEVNRPKWAKKWLNRKK
ncbi:hypothetical protein [Rheinheimera sp. WS51]|uniref:hypothetical protein n=1 Tax=Rheinheimera sp. WS51 TaxID=3425886 RepID=UPI003D8BCD6B